MALRERGQLGSFVEDIFALMVIVIAIVSIIVFLESVLSSFILRQESIILHNRRFVSAGVAAAHWGFMNNSVILERAKVCTQCDLFLYPGMQMKVFDLRSKTLVCRCGGSDNVSDCDSRFLALIYNESYVSPAQLKVCGP